MDVLIISEDARVVAHSEAIGAIRLTETTWRFCFAGRLETLAYQMTRSVPRGAKFWVAEIIGYETEDTALIDHPELSWIPGGNHK
jgi:hypothetical protein